MSLKEIKGYLMSHPSTLPMNPDSRECIVGTDTSSGTDRKKVLQYMTINRALQNFQKTIITINLSDQTKPMSSMVKKLLCF